MGSVLSPLAAVTAMEGVDVGVATPGECSEWLGHTRLLRGWIDAFEAKVTSRLTEHHAAGQSAPAADTHTKCGGVSAAEGRRKERRSKTIKDAPGFGDALAEGGIGAEHVDQLAAATSRLDDTIKAALLDQDDLLDAARSQTPEKFGQTVRDRARSLEADNGIERNRQQRKQTFLSHKINHETGMHEGRFAFHPELGSRIFSAIDRQVLKNIKAGTARGEPEFVDRTFDYTQQAAVALGDIITRSTSSSGTTSGHIDQRTHTNNSTPPDTNNHNSQNSQNSHEDHDSQHSHDDHDSQHRHDGRDSQHSHDGRNGHDGKNSHHGHDGHGQDGQHSHDGREGSSTSDGGQSRNTDAAGDSQTSVSASFDRDAGSSSNGGDLDAGECRGIEADITVIIDYQTATTGQFHDHSVCETSDGAVLPPASVQRLLCNGRVTPVIMDAHGNPFNLGRTVRHANRKQRRALRAIYRSCGFPGCDVGFWKCDIHHIVPWELGGFTDLANMVPICSRHHHVIHEGGWQLNLAPDRTLTITQPTGQPYGTTTPDINRQTPHSRAGPPNDSIGEPPPESLVEPIRTQRVDRPPKPPERRPVGPDDPRQQMNLLTG